MSRTIRKYEPSVSCMEGNNRRFIKNDKKHGIIYGFDGMVETYSESTKDHEYKKHARRNERHELKNELKKIVNAMTERFFFI